MLDRDPEPIEQAVPLQGVAQQVGVEALGQQQGVGARGSQDDAHFIPGEARQRALVGEQRLADLALVQMRERLGALLLLQPTARERVDHLFGQAIAVEGVGCCWLVHDDFSLLSSAAAMLVNCTELRSRAVTLKSSCS